MRQEVSNIIVSTSVIKKMIIAVVLAVAFGAFGASSANAADLDTFRHAFTPHKDIVTGELVARLDNLTNQHISRLVCVEARNTSTGARTHLGCLMVEVDPTMSGGNWAVQFGAPMYLLGHGTYQVSYNYQASDGTWHLVTPPVIVYR